MSDSLTRANWNTAYGVQFADIDGARYCVSQCDGAYCVTRDGIEIAGPACLSGPAGYKTAEAAKKYAEWHADMHRNEE